MKTSEIDFRFVDAIPEKVEQGTLYISIEFATAVHRCCCGCGQEVVTPLSPTDWALTFDGEAVSLSPSIGSWSFPCRSHYWIRRNMISWAGDWTSEQIAAGRANDRTSKRGYYSQEARNSVSAGAAPRRSIWSRLWNWLR